jgi:GGDEF domain-containing protein
LLLLDPDHFKALSDTHGHAVGDQLLTEVAQWLQAAVRRGDTVARVGGDEYVLVLADVGAREVTAANESARLAEKIRGVLNQPHALLGAYAAPEQRQFRPHPLPEGPRPRLCAGSATSVRAEPTTSRPDCAPFGACLSASLACLLSRRLDDGSPELAIPSNPSSRPP